MTAFRAPLSRPADFFGFWSQTLAELARVAPAAAAAATGPAFCPAAVVRLGGVAIHGYLLRWEDGSPGPWSSTATATAGRSRRVVVGGPASTWLGWRVRAGAVEGPVVAALGLG